MAEKTFIVRALIVGALTIGFAACGGDGRDDPAIVREATLAPGDPIEPSGEPILALGTGAAAIELDVATIERLELLEVVVDEPYERREMLITGVRLRDVLAIAGTPGGDMVHLHALDDYTVDLTLDEATGDDVILATRVDGEPIPLDGGGPTRLVFTDGSSVGDDNDLWIWSLDQITVQ